MAGLQLKRTDNLEYIDEGYNMPGILVTAKRHNIEEPPADSLAGGQAPRSPLELTRTALNGTATPPFPAHAAGPAESPLQTHATPEAILRRAQLNLLEPYQNFVRTSLGYAPDAGEMKDMWSDFREAGRALPTAGQNVGQNDLSDMARARQWQALANATQGGVPNTMTQGEKLMGALNAFNMQGHKEVADLEKSQQNEAALRYQVTGDVLGRQNSLLKSVLDAARAGITAQAGHKFQFDYVPGIGYMRADPLTGEAALVQRAFHGKDMAKLYEDLQEAGKNYDFLGACNGDQDCAAQLRRRWLEQEFDKKISQFGFNRPGSAPQVPGAPGPQGQVPTFESPDVAMSLIRRINSGERIKDAQGIDVTDQLVQALMSNGYPVKPAAPKQAAPSTVKKPATIVPPLLDPAAEKARGAEAEAIARSAAEADELLNNRINASSRNVELIRRLESLGDPFVNPFADYMTAAGGMLQQLGANGDLIKMATTTSQVAQVVNDMVASMQLTQKGVQTDKDAERYAKAQVDYRFNTPEGYRLNLRYLKAMNEYQLRQGQVRDEYKAKHRDSTIGFATHWADYSRKDPMSAYYVNPSADREVKQRSIELRKSGALKDSKSQDKWIADQLAKRRQLIFRDEFLRSYMTQFSGKTQKDAEEKWREIAKEQ